MSASSENLHLDSISPQPLAVRSVSVGAPWRWLRHGIEDFRRIPGLSVACGAIFAALCIGFYVLSRSIPWYTVGFITGLVVLGPFLAAGLYTASRDLSSGSKPSIARSLDLLGQRRVYLTLFSLMLALIMAAWVRFSALLFAIKFNTLSPSIDAYVSLFSSGEGWIALTYFFTVGFILVAAVFTVSAIAIPLILDRDTDFVTAITTSSRAVFANPAAMSVWAVIIVTLTAVGIALAFVGLAIIFPILGYATWHSYREIIGAK